MVKSGAPSALKAQQLMLLHTPQLTALLSAAIFSVSRGPGKRKLGWNWDLCLMFLLKKESLITLLPDTLNVWCWQV